jgi:hypothetical protein
MRAEAGGRYRLEVRGPDGALKADTGWFDNLITDAGLEMLGKPMSIAQYCYVGTGNAAPTTGDVVMQQPVATTGGAGPASVGSSGAAPYYGYCRRTYAFAQGAVVGNIAEVGVGENSTSANYLFSRSLVSPAISITAIDQLSVVYELRTYAPAWSSAADDVTGSVDIGGHVYAWAARPFRVHDSWGASIFTRASGSPGIAFTTSPYGGSTTAVEAPAALVSPVMPTNTIGGGTSPGSALLGETFNPGVHIGGFGTKWATNTANYPQGVQGIIADTYFGRWQLVFDAPIPKDNTKELMLWLSVSWARRP